ncbi:hypothetical protein F511_04576 [Dorcoceras hygrometricum]|uniref:Uncharacterized protein n=1 Tax=Dorcoceras hygrometricum TaxID=472368 RepID=A0A2Z7B732_9LAMI|nr:hypothetical protein F511_04576 [Dorcoceras hygrometricum]
MNLAANMINSNSKMVPMSFRRTFASISSSHRMAAGGSDWKIPARDRPITFGKHRGKMLGSLPSSYLKWVSKNLRSGDTQEWAKLADEVLLDSVYKDRIEWELAENVLNGNNVGYSSSGNKSVSALLEMSERFGWDNEDKVGWSKIDFGLLGTSKGGRIPRRSAVPSVENGGRDRGRVVNRPGGDRGRVVNRPGGDEEDTGSNRLASSFPGREALLNKVRSTRGFRLRDAGH